jgi:hypothetical protein
MKTQKTIALFIIIITANSGCLKLLQPDPKTCGTYPEDGVRICGTTHSRIAGKTWHLDSVVINGQNKTTEVLANYWGGKFEFKLETKKQTEPGISYNFCQGNLAYYRNMPIFYVVTDVFDTIMYIQPDYSLISDDTSKWLYNYNSPVVGFLKNLYTIDSQVYVKNFVLFKIMSLKNNKILKLKAINNDTTYFNYFSVKK